MFGNGCLHYLLNMFLFFLLHPLKSHLPGVIKIPYPIYLYFFLNFPDCLVFIFVRLFILIGSAMLWFASVILMVLVELA